MADDAITRISVGVLQSPFYICLNKTEQDDYWTIKHVRPALVKFWKENRTQPLKTYIIIGTSNIHLPQQTAKTTNSLQRNVLVRAEQRKDAKHYVNTSKVHNSWWR